MALLSCSVDKVLEMAYGMGYNNKKAKLETFLLSWCLIKNTCTICQYEHTHHFHCCYYFTASGPEKPFVTENLTSLIPPMRVSP